nr:CMP-N-acetylneuraminate-poly-alpha-2,8-sialyltransferase-like [Lytechinus pictus]
MNTSDMSNRYACSRCDKTFSRKYDMQRHEQNEHDTGEETSEDEDSDPSSQMQRVEESNDDSETSVSESDGHESSMTANMEETEDNLAYRGCFTITGVSILRFSFIRFLVGFHFSMRSLFVPLQVKSATKRFERESPFTGRRYQKCAIVGNSGSLQNSKCGSQIDSMDFVFRCNGAPIEAFMQDAGKRTDFVTFNPSILFKNFGGLTNESAIASYIDFMVQYNSVIWYPCFGARHLVEPCLKAMSYRDQIDSQLVIGHPSHYVSMWEFWKRRGLKKKPSTGFFLINVAATMCNEIHLYGFWPFPVELRERTVHQTAYHYFNEIPFTSHHNSDGEFRILLQMHMLGTLNLHTGACTQ